MVDTKPKDDKSKEADPRVAAKSSDATKSIYEMAEENYTRFIDEIIKFQSECSRAVSNLQSDYIQTTKNTVLASFLAQKQLANYFSDILKYNNIPLPPPYMEQFLTRQSDGLANNSIGTLHTNNQLTLNLFEAARDNLKIINQMANTITESYSDVLTSWNVFLSQEQQRLFK
jgi:hypothetical protein